MATNGNDANPLMNIRLRPNPSSLTPFLGIREEEIPRLRAAMERWQAEGHAFIIPSGAQVHYLYAAPERIEPDIEDEP